jgi:hypothetical protein
MLGQRLDQRCREERDGRRGGAEFDLFADVTHLAAHEGGCSRRTSRSPYPEMITKNNHKCVSC